MGVAVPERNSEMRVTFNHMNSDGVSENGSIGTRASGMDELDEETIRWGTLIARIVAIFLLVCTIAAFCLGGVSEKFYILGGVICCASLMVLYCSFSDYAACRSRYIWNGKFDSGGGLINKNWIDSSSAESVNSKI